jgi:acetyl-CoA carboxylase carboxyl transferase subunit beta
MRNLFRKAPPYVTVPGQARPASDSDHQGGDGLWVRCENERCRELLYVREFENNLKVCQKCQHHARLSARERLAQLVDEDSFVEHDAELEPCDPLGFAAAGASYRLKLEEAISRSGEREAAIAGSASIEGLPIEIVLLDFAFMGASMGSVVGEKLTRACDRAIERHVPLVTVSASGGARMQEGIFSLMQMAKTVAALARLGAARVQHVSILADPTLGGVTASYAGVGDVIIVEEGALVGFAGPRVIEQITKQKLPADAQRAAFLLEHGMADLVLHRRELRPTLVRLLRLYNSAKLCTAGHPGEKSCDASNARGVPLKEQDAASSSAWERVQLARHPQRPYTLDYLQLAFREFVELHGDRLFADDPAIVGGLASLASRTVMVIGHQKGRDTRENILRRFGMARPEGYRKALRLMKHAEKFGIPVVTLIDIPGADPSLVAEERGQAFAIAENLLAMSELHTPIVSAIIGEGGSGGALALGVADRVLMLENAIYSVASPEAAASILWKDGSHGAEAAEAMRITASDLLAFGVVDAIIREPADGAHHDYAAAAQALQTELIAHLAELGHVPVDDLVEQRARRYRNIGVFVG